MRLNGSSEIYWSEEIGAECREVSTKADGTIMMAWDGGRWSEKAWWVAFRVANRCPSESANRKANIEAYHHRLAGLRT